MTDDELAAIEARVAAATPGPWEWRHPLYGNTSNMYASSTPDYVDHDGEPVHHAIIETDGGFYGPNAADKAFIAAARDDIPVLIAEVRRLRAIVEGQP